MSLALPTGPLVHAIGWSLLHLLWQGALVASLLAVTLALLSGRSAGLRYVVSCLALALLVVLGVATGIRSYRAEVVPSVTGTENTAPPVRGAVTIATSTPFRTDRLQALRQAANDALPQIVMFWLAGVGLFSARLLIEWLRVQRLVTRHVANAPEPWPSAARRLSLALGVRRVVRVLESVAVEVPSVIGLMRPAILIPASSLTGLTPEQLEMILAHELAHIRRHDFLVNLLQAVVETLLFYHPAVWWISRQVRNERENCCDDLAVAACGNRLQYARALLRLDELRARNLALASSASGGSLFARIRRIALGSTRTAGPAVRALAALAVQLCVLIAIAVPSISAVGRPWEEEAAARAYQATPAATAIQPSHKARAAAAPARPAPSPARKESGSPSPSPSPSPISPDEAGAAGNGDAAPDAEVAAKTDADAGQVSLDDLISLRVHGVTPEDIRQMRSMFGDASLQDIASMKAVGATPGFVREMRTAGLSVTTAEQAQSLAALGVTKGFIREMRSVGFPVASAEEATSLKAVGVSAAFVRDIRSRGLDVNAEEAQGMAALGVTPEYVDALRKAGVPIHDADDVRSLRAIGITPEFIQRLARAGYRNLSVEQLTRLGAAGVTGDFIQEMSKYRSR